MKKKPILITVLIAVIAVIIGVVSFNGRNQTAETSDKSKAAVKESSDMVTIHIDNGAADANSDSAVNGLHVYDPESEDLDDFVDGAEVPKGTKVSIYVYNLASEVHLDIKHNGETIADKDYGILQSDDDVEFFDVTLEGDLYVNTSVINSKNKNDIATVHINNSLATVSMDGEEIDNNKDIDFGEHDFTVKAGDKDIKAQLKIGDKNIDTKTIKAGKEYVFDDQNVDGDVFFHFDYANKKDKKEAEENAKNPNSKVGDKSVTEGGYSITVVNNTGVELDVRYLDDNTNVHNVVSGNHYPEGLDIWARVINTSSDTLSLTAMMGGKTVGSTTINPKPANDDATYNGLGPISLKGNLVITLSKAGNGTKNTSSKNNQGGGKTVNPSKPSVPGTEDEYALVTINDGAKTANTDTAVNGLHVYNPDDPDLADISSGTKLPIGTRLIIYEYNMASEVHLTVDHNGQRIADKKLSVLQSDADVQEVEVTLTGDLTVTTTVGKNTDIPVPEKKTASVTEIGNVVPSSKSASEAASALKNVSVVDKGVLKVTDALKSDIESKLQTVSKHEDEKFVIQLYIRADEVSEDNDVLKYALTPSYRVVKMKQNVPDNTANGVTDTGISGALDSLVNSTSALEMCLPVNGFAKDGETVYVRHTKSDGTQYTYDAKVINQNAVFTNTHGFSTFEISKKPWVKETTHMVNVDNKVSGVSVNLSYLNDSFEYMSVKAGDAVKEGTGIFVQVLNPTNQKVKVTAYVNNKAVGSTEIDAGTADDPGAGGLMGENFSGITLSGDMKIVVEPVETSYQITVSGNAKDKIDIYDNTNDKSVSSGDSLKAGTYYFSVYNKDYDETETTVILKVNGKTIGTGTATEYNSADFMDVTVNGDVEFVAEREETSKEATITIVDNANTKKYNNANNTLHVYDMSLGEDAPEFKDGDKIQIGHKLTVEDYNTATDVHIVITNNGETIVDEVAPVIDYENNFSGFDYEFEVKGDVTITTSIPEEPSVNTFENTDQAASYVKSQMLERNPSIVFNYKGTFDKTASQTIMSEVFNVTDKGNEGDYLRYSNNGYQAVTSDNGDGTVKVTYTVKFFTTKEQEEETARKLIDIETKLNVFDKSDYEKAKAVYDWICENVTYDYQSSEADVLKNTAYQALTKGTAQCEGYSNLFYRMMKDLGVETRLIAGTYDGGGHAWNIVKIGNKWYGIDTTHGSQLQDQNQTVTTDKNNTAYFLKGSDNFTENDPYDEYKSETFTSAYPLSIKDYVLNTDQSVNHLYITGSEYGTVYSESYDAYKEGAELTDDEVTLVLMGNKAGVQVKVTSGGKTIYEGEADSGIGTYVTVKVQDDVKVEFSVPVSYKVNIQNETDATLNVRWLDGVTPVDIKDGETFDEVKTVYTQLINTTDKKIKLTALKDGTEVQNVTLDKKPADDDGTYGGLNPITLNGNLTIKAEYVNEADTEYTVSLSGDQAFKATVYVGNNTVKDGDKVKGKTKGIYIYNLDYDDALAEAEVTVTVDGKVVSSGKTAGYELDLEDIEITGKTVIDISTPSSERETYKLTINDGAKAANTETAVNGLHVYDPGDKNLDDMSDGAEIKKGQKLTIYEYNFATDVHLTVTHNGEKIFDQILKAPVNDSTVQFVEIDSVEGDVVVTTEVPEDSTDVPKLHINDDSLGWVYKGWTDIHEGASLETGEQNFTIYANNDPIHVVVKSSDETLEEFDLDKNATKDITVNVTGDLTVEFTEKTAEEKQTHTVNVDNQVSDVTVNLSYLDTSSGTPKSVKFDAGTEVKTGTGVFVQVLNPTNQKVKVTAYVNNKAVGSTEIDAGTADNPGAGGLMGDDYSGIALSDDMKITVEPIKETYVYSFTGSSWGVYMDDAEIKDGASIEAGNHTFDVYATDEPVHAVLKVNDQVIDEADIDAIQDHKFENVTVNGKVTIEVTKK